ncbi:hypothetical protein [Nonomuraea dietziae]|uniref:hypothetical protein n=1 Tax=Nonomuraea dietziae TaxID=65515 RepID=UPI0031E1F431
MDVDLSTGLHALLPMVMAVGLWPLRGGHRQQAARTARHQAQLPQGGHLQGLQQPSQGGVQAGFTDSACGFRRRGRR